jgi:4-amino-4-deoxy-L-arabinose transferase-like glycosyltransferase
MIKLIINKTIYQIFEFIRKIKPEIMLVVLIITIGAFLRLYHIELFGFANDQARDANFAQQIIHGKIIYEGPQFSIDTGDSRGHLGPFYYYFIAPVYLFFGGSPIGNVLLIAFLNIASIYLIYIVGKKYFNSTTGIFSAIFLCFSYYAIYHSRFPWNPNIMIFFILLLLNYLYKANRENEKYYILVGLLFAIVTQIQASTFLLIPCFLLLFLSKLLKVPKVKTLLCSIGIFVLTYIPIIVYDIFHKFINSKAYVLLVLGRGHTPGGYIPKEFPFGHDFILYFQNLFGFTVNQEKYIFLLIVILVLFSGYLLSQKNKHVKIIVILGSLLLIFYALTAYKNPIQEYFFLTVTPFVFLILSSLLAEISAINKYFKLLIIILLIIFIYRGLLLYQNDISNKIDRTYVAEFPSQTLWPDIENSVNYMINFASKKSGSSIDTFQMNYQTCPSVPFLNTDAFGYAFDLKKVNNTEENNTDIYYYIIQPPKSLTCAVIDRDKWDIIEQKQFGKVIILTGIRKTNQ